MILSHLSVPLAYMLCIIQSSVIIATECCWSLICACKVHDSEFSISLSDSRGTPHFYCDSVWRLVERAEPQGHAVAHLLPLYMSSVKRSSDWKRWRLLKPNLWFDIIFKMWFLCIHIISQLIIAKLLLEIYWWIGMWGHRHSYLDNLQSTDRGSRLVYNSSVMEPLFLICGKFKLFSTFVSTVLYMSARNHDICFWARGEMHYNED